MTINEMIEEVVEDDLTIDSSKIPLPTDPEWVDYVLDQLADHELPGGNPTTDGLRRVTEKIYGEILESDTEILEIPKLAFTGKVTAKHTLLIRKYENDQMIKVSACVDVIGDKLPPPFNEHLVASACTRAEGKALRRALKIRVQTVEEINNTEEEDFASDQEITDQQIIAIGQMCKRIDVDVVKFIKSISEKVNAINDLQNSQARTILSKLSEFQRTKVPAKFQGFETGWETSFRR